MVVESRPVRYALSGKATISKRRGRVHRYRFDMVKHLLSYVLMAGLLAACAPRTITPLVVTPGAMVESIHSEVSLALASPAGTFSGRGYLVYQKPDRSRLVILSPIGTSVMEVFTDGDRLTLVIPSRETAYSGTFDEIPARSGFEGWKVVRWLVEDEAAGSGEPGGERVRINRAGMRETVWYDEVGLVSRKKTDDGAEVVYRDYRGYDGVPFPSVIEFRDLRGTSLKITFDEPELNRPVEEKALKPNLDGLTVLSIRRFGVTK